MTNNLFSFDLFYFSKQTLENIRKYFQKKIFHKQKDPYSKVILFIYLLNFLGKYDHERKKKFMKLTVKTNIKLNWWKFINLSKL